YRHGRRDEGATPFRSFGTFSVWFPRGLMLRLAARQACARLLQDWERQGDAEASSPETETLRKALADPALEFKALRARIEETARLPNEGKPGEALTGFLWQLEEQSMQPQAQDDPGAWAQQAMSRLQEWVGSSMMSAHDSSWRQSRLARALTAAVQIVGKEWD